MTPPPTVNHGYSVIELAIVLAVTALIAVLGASAYRTHAVRGEIARSIALAGSAQERVTSAFKRYGEAPADGEVAGLTSGNADRGPYVDKIDIVDGRIDLHFGDNADAAIAGRTLSLTPFETVDGEVIWTCGNRIPSAGLQPLGFASGGRQSVHVLTRIEARYLPSSCR